MSFLQTKNNATSLTSGLNNTNNPVTFSVTATEGSKFPNTASGPFRVTVWSTAYTEPNDDANMEILEVASRSGDALN